MIVGRFMMYWRYFLLKNYISAGLFGSLFGLAYSPFYLAPKIDKYRLNLMLLS